MLIRDQQAAFRGQEKVSSRGRTCASDY